MAKIFQYEVDEQQAKQTFDMFYCQGIDHAVDWVKVLSKKYNLPEAFLLELSIELNKLKEK